jgi:hypothetical protein
MFNQLLGQLAAVVQIITFRVMQNIKGEFYAAECYVDFKSINVP